MSEQPPPLTDEDIARIRKLASDIRRVQVLTSAAVEIAAVILEELIAEAQERGIIIVVDEAAE